MTNLRVLFVLTSHAQLGNTGKETGFYLPEVTHPEAEFERAGIEVEFVSPQGGKAPMTGENMDDPLDRAFLENPVKVAKIEHTLTPAEIDPNRYNAIFYAGGHGTMWDFPDNELLSKIGAAIYDRGGIIGSVCHGAAGLLNIKLSDSTYLIMGKTISSFTNEEEIAVGLNDVVPFLLESMLIDRGANHTKSPNFQTHAEVCDRLVTGQNPASAKEVGAKMVKLMLSN
jgi:putative intracellular protease/amidase